VFSGDGSVSFGSGAVITIMAEWFGVDPSATSANNNTYMGKAIASIPSGGGKLKLTKTGTYTCNAALALSSNQTLDVGEGVVWSIDGTSAAFHGTGSLVATTTLAVDITSGDLTITLTDASSFVVDKYIWIFHTTAKGIVDVMEITQIVGDVVTLKQPARFSWTAADDVTVKCATPVENIHITGKGIIQNLTALDSGNLIYFFWGVNCEVSNLTLAQRQGTSRCVLFASGYSIGSAYCTAKNLRILESSEHALECYALAYGTKFINNTVEQAGTSGIGAGISIRGSGHIISGNVIRRSLGDGINVGIASNVIITNNNVSGAYETDNAGIRVATGNINTISISGNICSGNDFGLYIYDNAPSGTESITVTGNNFNGNITGPMYCVSGFEVTFFGNTPTLEIVKKVNVATSEIGEDTLYTQTIPGYSLGQRGGLKIRMQFNIDGAAGLKTIKIYWGGTLEITSLQQWDEAGNHVIDAVIMNNDSFTAQTISWFSFAGVNFESNSRDTAIIDVTSDVILLITGECADGADTITLEHLIITPIGQAL